MVGDSPFVFLVLADLDLARRTISVLLVRGLL